MSETKVVEDQILKELEDVKKNHSIEPGSAAHESYLSAGYPDIGTREHAIEIITARDKDHSSYPWDIYMRAKAFIDALDHKLSNDDFYHPQTDKRGNVTGPALSDGRGKAARRLATQ